MEKTEPIKYLSLKSAGGLYGYTRDHLGLMIRQGRLKGLKLGNYYVTTAQWMVEYIKKYADQNHPIVKNKLSNKFLNDIFSVGKITETPAISHPSKGRTPNLYKNNRNDSRNDNIKSSIESDILKDLALCNLPLSSPAGRVKNNEAPQSFSEDNFVMLPDAPYTIVPIRKMEDAERKFVFKKLKY